MSNGGRVARLLRHLVALALVLAILWLYISPPPAVGGGGRFIGAWFGLAWAIGVVLGLRGLLLAPLLVVIGAVRLGYQQLTGPPVVRTGEQLFFMGLYVVIFPMMGLVGILLGASMGWRLTGR